MSQEAPPVLYKYFSEPEHADALVRRGTIRIGTLGDFRKLEESDSHRGDRDEGTKTIQLHRYSGPASGLPREMLPAISDFPSYVIPHFKNMSFEVGHHVEDCYVLCASQILSGSLKSAFGQHVVRIDDPLRFVVAITKHMWELGLLAHDAHGLVQCALKSCVYRDRTFSIRDNGKGINPVFLKDCRYAFQREFRTAWCPLRLPIAPAIITCPGCRDFCSLV